MAILRFCELTILFDKFWQTWNWTDDFKQHDQHQNMTLYNDQLRTMFPLDLQL